MFLNCSETDGDTLYKVLIGAIIPRPIAWVSTTSRNGLNNLAPFSFFNCFGVDPPMVGFAPAYKSIVERGGQIITEPKDTLRNIEETNEFVINIVSLAVAEKMNETSAQFPPDVSEFQAVGLTALPSKLVSAPSVKESPVNLECKLLQVIRHGHNNLVLGEIVGITISDDVIGSRMHVDAGKLQAIGRLAGNWYATTTDRFEIKRPG